MIGCLSEGIETCNLQEVYTIPALAEVGKGVGAGRIPLATLLRGVTYVEVMWLVAAGFAWYVVGRRKVLSWYVWSVVGALLWHLNGAAGGVIALAYWIHAKRVELTAEVIAERWLLNAGGAIVYVALVLTLHVLAVRRREARGDMHG